MVSFTIPILLTRETRPDRRFCLPVATGVHGKIPTWLTSSPLTRGLAFPPMNSSWATPRSSSMTNGRSPKTSSANGARPSTAKGFRCFHFLPLELQDQVREACIEPVSHTVVCLVEVDPDDNILSKIWLFESPLSKVDRRTLPVPLFHICQRSRAVEHNFYRVIRPGVFYSPRFDTLRLSIISATKNTRRPTENPDPPRWHFKATSSVIDGPFFNGEPFFEDMRDIADTENSEYFYLPHRSDWASS